MLSYQTWRDRYGSDPNLGGTTISISGLPFDIVGVLPEDFHLTSITAPSQERHAAWVPVGGFGEELDRGNHRYEALGRLAEGVSLDRAQEETAQILRDGRDPASRGGRLALRKTEEEGNAEGPLLMLLAAVGVLMLKILAFFTKAGIPASFQ